MHILCPHCRNPIEVVKLTPREELSCPSCGSSFCLETGSTTGPERSAGAKLGKFTLLDTVGQGAFGTVYKAHDPELDRTVAVKVPRAGNLAGPQDLDRFVREARSVAQLRHPSIVSVHEVGQHDGLPYLVSDFVQGVTLADLMSARRPSFREAADLVAHVADALHFAHGRGVVHRDVKPSNILIGEDGKPCVMDFGLAKRDAGEITMTLEGQVLGTPAYMSPEQAGGEAHAADARSDVYSLGVILYELLTGEPPFRGTKRMLLHQVLHDDPRSPRCLNDKIPRDLETVCLRAMAKEPARRYATAAELAEELRRWLNGEPIKARPVGRLERGWRWCRRNPAVAGLLAATSLLLLATLAAVSTGYWATAQAKRQAEEQRDLALRREEEAVGLREQEAAARAETEKQRRQSQENLRASLLHQAAALRQSTQPGRRWLALAALRDAAVIRPDRDLRDEYLRCLELTDLRPLRELTVPADLKPTPALPPQADAEEWPAPGRDYWLLGEDLARTGPHRLRTRVFKRDDADVAEFDLRSGKAVGLFGAGGGLGWKALSPDGRFLVGILTRDRRTYLWDVNAGKRLGELSERDGQPLRPLFIAFSPTPGFLAVAAEPVVNDVQRVLLYRTPPVGPDTRHQPVAAWDVPARHLNCLRFDPSGTRLAASTVSPRLVHAVRLWRVPDGTELATLTLAPGTGGRTYYARPLLIDFSADGRRLFAAGEQGTLMAWDLSAGEPKELFTHTLPAPSDEAQVSPDGRWVATAQQERLGGGDHLLSLWDVSSRQAVARADLLATLPAADFPPAAGSSFLASEVGRRLRLWEFAQPLSRTVPRTPRRSQDDPVQGLALGNGDRWLAFSIGGDLFGGGTTRLIDLHATDDTQATLAGYPGTCALAFSAAGDRLGGASARGAHLWPLPSPPSAPAAPTPPAGGFSALAFNARGERLAIETVNRTEVRVLDVATGRELWSHFEPGPGTVTPAMTRFVRDSTGVTRFALGTLLFSPDGQHLATRADGERVTVRDSVTGRAVWERQEKAERLFFRGPKLLALTSPQTLTVRDLLDDRSAEPLRPMPAPRDGPYYTQHHFSDDGLVCAEMSDDGKIVLWDLGAGRRRATIARSGARPGFERPFRDLLAFSPDGSRVAAQNGDDLTVWDTHTGKELGKVPAQPPAFAFAPTGDDLWLINAEGRIQAWRPGAAAAPLGSLQTERRSSFAGGVLHFTADRRHVFLERRGTFRLWEVPSGRPIASLDLPRLVRETPAVSPDGRRIAFWVRHTVRQVRNLDAGDLPTFELPSHAPAIESFARTISKPAGPVLDKALRFSPDGSHLALVEKRDQEAAVRVFDLASRSERCAVPLKSARCVALVDGARRLAVGQDTQVLVFDPHTGARLAALDGHTGPISDLAFDRSGDVLASASADDGTARLWNPMTGELLASLDTGQRTLTRIALSPSGRWLAAGDWEGQVRVWDLAEARRQLKAAGLDWSAPPLPEPTPADLTPALRELEAARVHRLFDRKAESLAAYGRSLALDATQARVYQERGEALVGQDRYTEAVADFDKARALAPELPPAPSLGWALHSRGEAEAQQGRWEPALADFARCVREQPANASHWYWLALARLALDDVRGYREACAVLVRQAGSDAKRGGDYSAVRACVLAPDAVPDYEVVVTLAEKLAARPPKISSSQQLLGAVLCRAGRYEAAVAHLEEAVRLHRQEETPTVWLFLALAQHRLGHSDQARESLDKAARRLEQKEERLRSDWQERRECEFWRREVEALVKGTAPKP